MLFKSSKDVILKRGGFLVALLATGLLAIGSGLIALGLQPAASASAAPLPPPAAGHSTREVSAVAPQRAHRVSKRAERLRAFRLAARNQPHSKPRSTISLYEHGVRPSSLRRQGCSAAQRGVGGIVILDFGQPAYNGHTYGTYLFSGRFAGNKAITRAMLAYAHGYRRCLAHGSLLQIKLARGTSNYHPQVPSAYKAGRKWARETMALQKLLRARGLHSHVSAAAADDVEPAWDRTFHRTRDFFRGFRDARTGHLLYNFGSLDGGVGSVWNARQIFFVTSGMKYARAIPEIYNHAMARQWADLAHIAKKRYKRPLKFAGVMTTHTARNRGMKPNDAHKILVRALASAVREATPEVPPTLTNIVASAE
jgi:hypothetical protein